MKITFAYCISLLTILTWSQAYGQKAATLPDTVDIPLKIRAGIEVTGPAIYFYKKNNLSYEGYISVDLNEKTGIYAGGGYADYKYSQYNYDFLSMGSFVEAGVDLNLMKPEKSLGKYWAGIGIHYGLSTFTTETPSFTHENYWGKASSSVGPKKSTGHYLELAPGFRAEILKNLSIGWTVTLRKLITAGTSKDLKPVYFPGYGAGNKPVTAGISYYLVFNFRYKKIKVIIKPEPVEEPEEGTTQPTQGVTNTQILR